ncbi:MAG TPA: Rrf2 family transcriptional regulator [Thermoanaerobaculaceae bacterium]|nr:Rrf2 family transcriptional regulator [Thermoanaerobaculaceae bacterium]HRS17211.1 Rrf2 family transcriptional regulator [Thermoanaerobaculaceae bacterium]
MIGIARHTDYAARVVLHLACLEPGAQVTIAEIAENRLLPAPFVRRVVGKLVAAGLLVSTRGMGGGVRLARPAADISLLDVVMAMEGGVALNHCVDNPKACPLAARCPVQRAWTEATRQLEATLGAVTFDQLATRLERGVTQRGYARQELLRRAGSRRRGGGA